MAQGCTKHPWNANPNCLACQVKDTNRSLAYTAAATDEQIALAAEANFHAASAALDAEQAAESQLRQERNTANYQLSMWRQSSDGQQWEAWAEQAKRWLYWAEHPDKVLDEWKQAAAPGWDDAEAAKRHEDSGLRGGLLWLGVGLLAAVGFVAAFLSNVFAHDFFKTIQHWTWWPAAGLAAWGLIRSFRAPADPKATALKEMASSGFTERYADPFENPDALPSWRAGLTRAENAQQIAHVREYLNLDGSYYPRPSELPALPELVARPSAELPDPVATEIAAIRSN